MTSKKKRTQDRAPQTNANPTYMIANVSDLNPYANNPKRHPAWHINQIQQSIEQFGFITPIIVNDKYEIIAGHGRFAAAKQMALLQVPVILIDTLSDAEIKAYRIADNQLNLNTEHDIDLLRIELQELDGMDLEFNLEVTGISTGQLDIIIGGEAPAEDDQADHIPQTEEHHITKSGDLWIMGDHKMYCGDALETSSYQAVMGDKTADAVFTDPPYNCHVSGHICGNGKIQHDEFAMASGEMSDEEFEQFLAVTIKRLIEYSEDGSLHYICIDWRNIYTMISAAEGQYKELKNICIWNKSNAGMGALYRSKHEFVPVFKKGTAPHTNNVLLGKSGRYRSNVWDYPGVNCFGHTGELEMHPTVKPAAMVADAIMDCTKRGGIVLDPFGGSGSTLIAAEMSGRCARIIELEPKYCDVTIRRWQELTGKDAIHAASNKSFAQIMQQRGSNNEE